MKKCIFFFITLVFFFVSCSKLDPSMIGNTAPISQKDQLLNSNSVNQKKLIDFTTGYSTNDSKVIDVSVSLVKIGGRVAHFGYDITVDPPVGIPYENNVDKVKVWLAEFPASKNLNLKSNAQGWWEAWVLKFTDYDLHLSFVFEKEGWITTKSNLITLGNMDTNEIGIQFIDPIYYNNGVKPMVEAMLLELSGIPMVLERAMVATVCKSWASLNNYDLPHGDPGAIVTLNGQLYVPQVIGPVYFNEAVMPDPYQVNTSVDGGVVFLNQPYGSYTISAHKPGVVYETVDFSVTPEDEANGIVLYIASPPNSVMGDNDSAPGAY